jgi:hypothetical protein
VKTKMGVSQLLAAVAATLLAITFCTPAAARSGNDMIKACHGVLEIDRPGANEALIQGVCMGTVFTLMQLVRGQAISTARRLPSKTSRI